MGQEDFIYSSGFLRFAMVVALFLLESLFLVSLIWSRGLSGTLCFPETTTTGTVVVSDQGNAL